MFSKNGKCYVLHMLLITSNERLKNEWKGDKKISNKRKIYK